MNPFGGIKDLFIIKKPKRLKFKMNHNLKKGVFLTFDTYGKVFKKNTLKVLSEVSLAAWALVRINAKEYEHSSHYHLTKFII